jgi:hypothetical protein
MTLSITLSCKPEQFVHSVHPSGGRCSQVRCAGPQAGHLRCADDH